MRQPGWSARILICGVALLAAPTVATPQEPHTFAGTAPMPGPNIIVIISDDYAWPYYGFMQRYLEKNLADGIVGKAYEEDMEVSYPKHRYGMLLPNASAAAMLPKIEDILTPALDSLASDAHGQYFPLAHLGASICKPGLATALTGLHLADSNRTGVVSPYDDSSYVTSPVLPEHLRGFWWGSAMDGINQGGTVQPKTPDPRDAQYLTMGAGKWRYTQDTFGFDDDGASVPPDCDGSSTSATPPCRNPTATSTTNLTDKFPFDYDLTTGADSAGTRDILAERLEEVKDFIDCALCVNNDGESGNTCDPKSGYASSGRLEQWENRCQRLDDNNPDPMYPLPTNPRPFFIVYNPLIPHDGLDTEQYCPDFDMITGSYNWCTDSTKPYGQYSAYCNHPEGTAGRYTCQDFSTDLFNIGCRVKDDGVPDRNIYSDPGDCPTSAPYVTADFQRKGNYLRWINVFDRTVDEILVHLKARQVFDKTMILVLTDNGASFSDMVNSKGKFGENGYRTPFILYDPYSTPPAAKPDTDPMYSGCETIAGCRPEFAQFTDLVRTIRNAQVAYVTPPTTTTLPALPERLPQNRRSKRCSPTPPNPYDRATVSNYGSYPFREAFDLRAGSSEGFGSDTRRVCPTGAPASYKQCLFGHEKSGASAQSIQPGKGWYVLAEVEETVDPGTINERKVRHLCKYYHEGSLSSERLYDLICDPNEQIDLTKGADDNVPDYDPNYCNTDTVPAVDLSGGSREFCEAEKANLRKVLYTEVVCNRRWSTPQDWVNFATQLTPCSVTPTPCTF